VYGVVEWVEGCAFALNAKKQQPSRSGVSFLHVSMEDNYFKPG
jgi:hypothetical protein